MSYSWGAAARNLSTDEYPRAVVVDDIDPDADPVHMRRLAAELAPMVAVWERLIDQHTPNRSGRCRKCTKGGTGLPSTPWPCSVYGVAEMARRRHDRDHR
jgi:hypothetical protein